MAHDNIWFTYKARIRAHVRLAKDDFHSQAILVWYAFCSAVLAMLTVRFPSVLGKNTDILAAVLSIALLVMSLMVTGRDFRGRALEMRRNYLALESLHRQSQIPDHLSTLQIEERFSALLEDVENHTSLDDKCARVFHSGPITRSPSGLEIAAAWGYVIGRILVLCFLYGLPIGITLYMLFAGPASAP